MNIGESFPVYCIEVADKESGMLVTFFRFPDHVSLAVDNSFVKINESYMSMDEETLAFSLIAEGLLIVEAKFAASVILALASKVILPAKVGIENKTENQKEKTNRNKQTVTV